MKTFRSVAALAVALCVASFTIQARGQDMPDEIRKHVTEHLIGRWEEETTFDGETSPSLSTWKWAESKKAIVCDWRGPASTAKQVGYWDPKENAFVIRGQSSTGDFWTTWYDKRTPSKWSGRGSGTYKGSSWDSDVSIEWSNDGGSYAYRDVTEGKPFVVTGRRIQPNTLSEALFEEWLQFLKGTWTWVTPEDENGELTWSRDVNAPILMAEGELGELKWVGCLGRERHAIVDTVYDSAGGFGRVRYDVITEKTLSGIRHGLSSKGAFSTQVKITRVDKDTFQVSATNHFVAGKKREDHTFTLKRK